MARGRLKNQVLVKLQPANPANRVCAVCGQEQPLDSFTFYQCKYHSHTCKSCHNQKNPFVPCSICGTLRRVRFVNGKPKSLTCVKCVDRSRQIKAMRQANIGRLRSEETRAKISIAWQEKPPMYALVPPENPSTGDLAVIGKHHRCVWYACPICGIPRWVRATRNGQPLQPYCRTCVSRLPEQRERKRLRELGKKHSPERVEKNRQAHIGQIITDETKDKIRQYWKDPEWRRYAIHQQRRYTCPNNPEKRLLQLLEELYPHDWRFVGDGSLVIGGLNPDFANINGKKLLIELFGDYWHRNDDPSERASCFTPFGFRTLVVWESELKDVPVLSAKIKEFIHA